VGKAVGVEAVELGSLRAEDAIGLVCNFAPLAGGADRELRSFSLARQFYDSLFKQLAEAGAGLENIVYTKSKASHYFVMTPTKKCLLDSGVVRDPTAKPMLAGDNVDKAALERLVRHVVEFEFKSDQPTLPAAAAKATGASATKLDPALLPFADNGPQLFDFSKLRRAAEGIIFLEPPGSQNDQENALLVSLVGDALLEPFWPEGLGVVRGFLSALDASFAIAAWADGASNELTKEQFAASYAQLKTLGAQTRASVLRADEKAYGLAPRTRYRAITGTSNLRNTM
jgi:hypothetical protein